MGPPETQTHIGVHGEFHAGAEPPPASAPLPVAWAASTGCDPAHVSSGAQGLRGRPPLTTGSCAQRDDPRVPKASWSVSFPSGLLLRAQPAPDVTPWSEGQALAGDVGQHLPRSWRPSWPGPPSCRLPRAQGCSGTHAFSPGTPAKGPAPHRPRERRTLHGRRPGTHFLCFGGG